MKTYLFASMLLLATATACGEAEEAFDCASICDRYGECVDEDNDVAACTDRCEDDADDSEAFADRVDQCEACIDDEDSCLEDAACVDECAFLVS